MKYLSLLKYGFKRVFAYKWSVILGFFVSIIAMYIMRMFWKAIYFNNSAQWEYMCNYVIWAEVLSISYTMRGATKLCNNIRDGSITVEFIRPRNYVLSLLFEDIGTMLGKVVSVGIPLLCFAAVIWGFRIGNCKRLVYFVIDILLSYIILFLFKIIIAFFSFWFIEAKALQIMADIIIKFFSGKFLPGWIMPDSLRKIIYKLPFVWIFEKPISFIFQNDFTMKNYLCLILNQLSWIIVLVAIAYLLWRSAQKKLIIQGG